MIYQAVDKNGNIRTASKCARDSIVIDRMREERAFAELHAGRVKESSKVIAEYNRLVATGMCAEEAEIFAQLNVRILHKVQGG